MNSRPGSGEGGFPAGEGAAGVAWAAGLEVPDYLALREGSRPLVFVAPHGGLRRRPIRRGDSVNDLHTAGIAWELAERLDAHAIVNHGLDRNDIDLNRISHLSLRAPAVLTLLAAAIEAASQGAPAWQGQEREEVPLVLFVHGWNMVVPCCDIGIGLKRRGGRLTGRFPVLSRRRYDTTIAAIERELATRGISAAIGRRYTASGRDNAAQLFSGRHAGHEHEDVATLGRLAAAGRVDAAQLELGIPLRWPGASRAALVEGLVDALSTIGVAADDGSADRDSTTNRDAGVDRDSNTNRDANMDRDSNTNRSRNADRDLVQPLEVEGPLPDEEAAVLDDEADIVPVPRSECGWRLAPVAAGAGAELEPGFALQALLDADGTVALFCGVEATGPHSMTARFSLVCTDGSMMLLVGEGEWKGEGGRYGLEGFTWQVEESNGRIVIELRAPMIRYPTHEAYLDLESGLASSRLVDAEVTLSLEATTATHGRLRGKVRAGTVELEVDTVAFLDRGGRGAGTAARSRLRLACTQEGGEVLVERSGEGSEATLTMDAGAGRLGMIRAVPGTPVGAVLESAEVLARVPVWRLLGEGILARWTFGIVRCRFTEGTRDGAGLFESVEVYRRPAPAPSGVGEPT
ncbi:MAG: hypothetical protein ABR538_12505 [Candidatus Binatia bacterium]